jgi:hypothetical protein
VLFVAPGNEQLTLLLRQKNSGLVPSNLWKLLKVEVIYLHNNKLQGVIDEWIKGTVAWEVRLDGNDFTCPLLRHGRFSTEVLDLRSITSMRVYIEERLKEDGGDLKLWAVDRLLVSAGIGRVLVSHMCFAHSFLLLPSR